MEHTTEEGVPQEPQEPQNEAPQAKRVLSEAQLRALAEGRKRAIKKRKEASVIKTAKKLEKVMLHEEKLEKAEHVIQQAKALEEGLVAKGAWPPSLPKERIPRREPPSPREAKVAESGQALPPSLPKEEPDYRKEYYREKLRLLREKQEEERLAQQWRDTYQRAPSSVLAADVAKQALMARTNKAVLERAYREMFPDDF